MPIARPVIVEINQTGGLYMVSVRLEHPSKDDIKTEWLGTGRDIPCAAIKAISGYLQCLSS